MDKQNESTRYSKCIFVSLSIASKMIGFGSCHLRRLLIMEHFKKWLECHCIKPGLDMILLKIILLKTRKKNRSKAFFRWKNSGPCTDNSPWTSSSLILIWSGMLINCEVRSPHSMRGIKCIFCDETSGQGANQRTQNAVTSWNGRSWDHSKLWKRFRTLTTNSNYPRPPVSIRYFMSRCLNEHPIVFLKTHVSIWIRTRMCTTSKRFLIVDGQPKGS